MKNVDIISNKISHKISKKYKNILENVQDASVEKKINSIVNYYESIIGCMPGNVYWLDKNAITAGCNRNVLKMFGFKSLEEFKGLTFEEMGRIGNWSPETTQSFKADTLEVIRTGKAKLNIEEPAIYNSDGKLIYFLTNRVPLFDSYGLVIGVVGISIDITERKKMEEDLKKAKEKSEVANNAKTHFLENMRHDIRTPLSAIVGLSELLTGMKDNSKIHEYQKYAQALADSSKELLRFLNQILESIHVASGNIPLLRDKFDLSTILNNLIKLNHPVAISKNLEINFNPDAAIPKYLIGDPIRIYRIVLELFINALKFTEKGFVKISTKLVKKEDHDLIIMIEVEDTGIGIPPEKQKELLLRFNRFTPSYQGIYKGAGLGLSIAKQFIDDLHGEIYIESFVHKGSKFVCLLPLQESLLDSKRGETFYEVDQIFDNKEFYIQNEQLEKPDLKVNILIVEDHESAATVQKNILTHLGCRVDIASNGENALLMCEERPYHFILMDIGLPDMNGYEVTKKMRTNKQSLNNQVPIIGLTAHANASQKREGIKSGMNLVLTKPLTEESAVLLLENYGTA